MNISKIKNLIERTYHTKTENSYWNHIAELRKTVNSELISECFKQIDSDDFKYKQIGIDVLCQLGEKRQSFIKELFDKIFKILEIPSPEKFICTALFAIGHNNKYLKIKHLKALQQFQNSKSKDIRYALTFSLLGIDHEIAIRMLIRLAQDRSPKVKDWATFGLGTQIETDNEEIRRILYKNCFSKDDHTKQEAIKGLSNRKDERVKEIILQELQKRKFWRSFILYYFKH